jgi:type I restriction enzyme S subunit
MLLVDAQPFPADLGYHKFLYYFFCLESTKNFIRNIAVGATMPSINTQLLSEVPISFPSIGEQREIGDILSALDDQIEANAKINHHLEQIAQAIFKSWFVDFEPWGGVMPNDWREGTFNEIVAATIGGDWGKDTPTGNNLQETYCIRGADIPEVNLGNKGKMPIRYILPKNYATKQLTVGDIVVEISGGSPTQSTGRCALITRSLLDRFDRGMVCTNFCRAVKPISGYSPFTYFYWKYLYSQDVFFSYENGTTGIKNLDISGLLTTEPIIIPTKQVADQFANVVGTFIDTVFANGLENETLARIRDALLPRLISGELSVADLDDAK